MDARTFDALTRALRETDTRRGLLGVLSAVPLGGGLAAFLDPDDAVDAKGRRKRRKKPRQHGKRRDTGNHKRKRQSSVKRAGTPQPDGCQPDPTPTTCQGKCGTVFNNCQKPVHCGSCDCDPPCGPCFTCQGKMPSSHCVLDPQQQGDACGDPGQVCQSDGSCACDASSCASCATCQGDGTCSDPCGGTGCCASGTCEPGTSDAACGTAGNACGSCSGVDTCGGGGQSGVCGCTPLTCPGGTNCGTIDDGCGGIVSCGGPCSNPTPICVSNACTACTSSDQCPATTICDGGSCLACDVCPTCSYSTVQAAITAANAGDTLRICPGTYPEHLTIDKSLSLIGAGQGNGSSDTILSGGGSDRVVAIGSGVTITLRTLRITGGTATMNNGGGIASDGTVTLQRCTVTGNHADDSGGGIANSGTLTLTDCTVSSNTAGANGGGISSNGALGATVTLTGCQITGNTAPVGGGLRNENGGTYTIDSTSITMNTATQANGGGGIFNEPSGGTVTLQPGTTVSGNSPNNCVGTISGPGCAP